jgi:hypothetical protein
MNALIAIESMKMPSLPCKDCITYSICKIDIITSAEQCSEWMHENYKKCSLFRNYVEYKNIHPFEKMERMLEIILYLCNNNIQTKTMHLLFEYQNDTLAYYCANMKKFFEADGQIPCPYCSCSNEKE